MSKWLPLITVMPLTIALDQFAKWWVVNNLQINETQQLLPALSPYLQLTRTINTGIAFGIGSGGSTLFLVLSLAISIGLLIFYARSPRDVWLQHIALSMILGGALGNILDRLRLGHVVDFVHITIPGIISNVSNFADHAIVIGVGVLLVDSYLQERRAARTTVTPVEET